MFFPQISGLAQSRKHGLLWLLQISVEWILQIRMPRSPYRTQSCVILLWQGQSFILTKKKKHKLTVAVKGYCDLYFQTEDGNTNVKVTSYFAFPFLVTTCLVLCRVSLPPPTNMLSPFCLQHTLFSSRIQAVSCNIVQLSRIRAVKSISVPNSCFSYVSAVVTCFLKIVTINSYNSFPSV